MSQHKQVERIVTDWLHAQASTAGSDRVLAAAISRMATTRQQSRGLAWRAPRLAGSSRSLRLAIGAAAVFVIVFAVGMSSRGDPRVASPSSRPTPSMDPSPSPTAPAPTSAAEYGPLRQGEHDVSWPGGPNDARIRVTIPADGWAWMGSDGSTIAIYKDHGRLFGFPADLETHTVAQVVTSACALDEASGEVGPIFRDVGPTVEDLVSTIAGVAGTSWSDPVDIMIGGRAGKRLVTTHHNVCPGPARRTIWEDPTGSFFVEEGMQSTIDVLDVDGDRLVLTENVRTTDPGVAAELDAIVSSMAVIRDRPPVDQPTVAKSWPGRPFPRAVGPDADLRVGRHRAIVEGIPFTFVVPESGWEAQLGFYLSRSITGPQGAEGTIRWTTIPNGGSTDACPGVLDDLPARSAPELADAVARAPGVDVVEGPVDITIGDRPGTHVRLRVITDRGCDPGYFYTYDALDGGAMWLSTNAGDVISVWIVEVDGQVLFIEAEATGAAWPRMEGSFRQMVESMAFE